MSSKDHPGLVSINHNSDNPDADNLPNAANRVVGLVPSVDAAWRTINRLEAEGFAEDQFEVFYGEEGAESLHSHHDRSGLLGLLRAILGGNLGPETDQSKGYEAEVKNGWTLLAVKATKEQTDPIREAMNVVGAKAIRYYGRFAIQDF